MLKQCGCVHYRLSLLNDETVRTAGVRNCVWHNAVGFLKVTSNTRLWDHRLNVGQVRFLPFLTTV